MHKVHPIFEGICESICPTISPAKRLMSEIHWLIHDACFSLSQGNLSEAKELLAKADQLSHDDEGLIK
jgi:hypothetical protein